MVIDRIEGGHAVVEVSKGEFVDVPVDMIEGRARDGAVLVEGVDGLVVDEAATRARTDRARRRLRSLFRGKSPERSCGS